VLSSFYYHYARLIEMLFAVERIQHLLSEAAILSKHVRAHARANNPEGVGIMEAPRGTLIHHYKVNDEGLITRANLIIATGHNNLAMNRGVLQVARQWAELAKGSLGWPEWSKDGQYVQFLDTGGTGAVIRVRISDHQTERVVDLKNFVYTGHYTTWLAIAPDGSPLLLRNAGTQDVYALDWEEP